MTGSQPSQSAWVRRFHPAPDAGTRLICLPHAGGSATYYFPLSRVLSPAVDVLAVQYPGRQDRRREDCVEDLRVLADLLLPEVEPWFDRPTAIFGHSMGATLGFELALRLGAAGIVPRMLFASGRRAPSTFRDERVHLYSDEAFIADLHRLSGTDPRMLEDEETVRMILPGLRSDYRAAETYRYRDSPRLACPVTALIGADDPQVTMEEAAAWETHTSAGFTLKVYPGGHFFLAEHAADLTALIAAELASAAEPGLPGLPEPPGFSGLPGLPGLPATA